jgi:dTDP-4-amino-4,6-dideoxy-D-galactose acyltransferase
LTVRINRLDWDSKFLGYDVCLINSEFIKHPDDLSEILHLAKNDGFRLCYFMFESRKVKLSEFAEKSNGILADDKVTYSISGVTDNNPEDLTEIIPYCKELGMEKMYKLSLQCSHQSRFRLDEHFGRDVCDTMYKIWISKSINGELADKVFVYTENGTVSGMITLYEKDDFGYIGLIGVDSSVRRNNIGGKLIRKAFSYFAGKQVSKIYVDTQLRNTEACSFYEKYGFGVKKITRVFHFWL